MAVETGLIKQAYGITFTVRTANAADWATVANDTTFYDIDTDKVYYKDGTGTVKGVFDGVASSIYTADDTIGAGRVATLTDTLTFDGGQVNIKGAGTSNGTNSLLVENNAGLQSLVCRDNGTVFNLGSGENVFNVSFGINSLISNSSGSSNSAFGRDTLRDNTTGIGNTATGSGSLALSISGSYNTAHGVACLASNTTGGGNCAFGFSSLQRSNSNFNLGFGNAALTFTTSGSSNVAVGHTAGYTNVTGSSNTYIGLASGYNSTGSNNVFIGSYSGSRETGNAKLMVDYKDRILESTSRNESIIYGQMASSPLNQTLALNASVGIGVAAGTAKLHVQGAGSTSATTALLVENSLGTTLFEVKDDGTLIGNYPVSVGTGTDSFTTSNVGSSATGISAIGFGRLAGATANRTIAIGESAAASTSDSVAVGRLSKARGGINATAVGVGTDANAANSLSLASYSRATATGAIGIGYFSRADGLYSIAQGYQADAFQNYSIGLGANMRADALNAIIIGGSTAAKINSTANSFEVNFNEATSTIRIGQSVDSWINTSANFGIGLNTGISAKLHVNGSTLLDGDLGVFGTTPVAQPTTAGAAAILATGAGTGLTDTDTFDGYTIQQVVKALRNIGILA